MKQTGRFYTLQNDKDGVQTEKPVKNTFLYFYQNDIRKITAQTDANGNFDFDLPIGSYTIKISQGASFAILDLFAGVPFELTSGSSQTALNDWLMNPVTAKPEENPLVIRLQELAQIATDAATEAQQIQQEMQNNSIGNANGKWIKEGGFGVGGTNVSITSGNVFGIVKAGFYRQQDSDIYPTAVNNNMILHGYSATRMSGILQMPIANRAWLFNSASQSFDEILSTLITMVDSNGFIKKASPIIKLFDDRIEHNDQFKEEPEFEKIDIGTYKISNTLGLAKGIEQGDWYIETPKNRNGLPYFMVEWEQCPETDEVIIRCFERKFDIEIGDFVNGELKDIGKDERWIDLRFHEEIEEQEI